MTAAIQETPLGIGRTLETGFRAALDRTREALAAEGFGIITEIDVRSTMKAKLDVEFADFTILGACAPALAHRALSISPEMGLMLPCNVVVRDAGDGRIRVEAVRAQALAGLAGKAELQSVAREADDRLRRVIEAL